VVVTARVAVTIARGGGSHAEIGLPMETPTIVQVSRGAPRMSIHSETVGAPSHRNGKFFLKLMEMNSRRDRISMLPALAVCSSRFHSFHIRRAHSRPSGNCQVQGALCRARRGRNWQQLSVFARMSLGVSSGESADRSHPTVTECA
jgi:hypothetical protein